jgi:hypothetical protein
MHSNDRVDRRHAIARPLALMGALACAPAWSAAVRDLLADRTSAEVLGEVISHFDETVVKRFDRLALEEWLETDPQLHSIVGDRGIRSVLEDILGAGIFAAPAPSSWQIRQAIERRIRADFAAEKILLMDGWMLARTEALLVWVVTTGLRP